MSNDLQKKYAEAIDVIKAFMYKYHPAGQALEPEGPTINLEKTFELAIKAIHDSKAPYIPGGAPDEVIQQMAKEFKSFITTAECAVRCGEKGCQCWSISLRDAKKAIKDYEESRS